MTLGPGPQRLASGSYVVGRGRSAGRVRAVAVGGSSAFYGSRSLLWPDREGAHPSPSRACTEPEQRLHQRIIEGCMPFKEDDAQSDGEDGKRPPDAVQLAQRSDGGAERRQEDSRV